jgi:hypothetical protein
LRGSVSGTRNGAGGGVGVRRGRAGAIFGHARALTVASGAVVPGEPALDFGGIADISTAVGGDALEQVALFGGLRAGGQPGAVEAFDLHGLGRGGGKQTAGEQKRENDTAHGYLPIEVLSHRPTCGAHFSDN